MLRFRFLNLICGTFSHFAVYHSYNLQEPFSISVVRPCGSRRHRFFLVSPSDNERTELFEQDVDSDGNCLFHGIRVQLPNNLVHLDENGNQLDLQNPQVLRRIAAAHIRAHPQDFPHIAGSDDYEELLRRMETDGEWEGEEAQQAIAVALGYVIFGGFGLCHCLYILLIILPLSQTGYE